MKEFTTVKQKLGEIGEGIAATYLRRHGYAILERNYTIQRGEVDIIASKHDILYFIEVKTMRKHFVSEAFAPESNFTKRKYGRLQTTTLSYLEEKQLLASIDWQIGLVAVVLDLENRKGRVRYYPNIL